jgi:protein-arginine kinase activator protein McsA
MQQAADNLEFETAAAVRDEIEKMKAGARHNKKRARR